MTDNNTPDTYPIASSIAIENDNTPQNISPEQTIKSLWVRRFWPLIFSMNISIAWVGVCLWWFLGSGKTLSRMPIYEMGGLLAGASLPLILIWLIALVFLRTDPLRDQRTALIYGLEDLLSPLDITQKRINTIVAKLHQEIIHVESAGDIAVKRINNLENRFQEQISNLFEATTNAEAKAIHIQETLSSERIAFNDLAQDITIRGTELEDIFRQLKFDTESLVNLSQKKSEDIRNELIFQNKTLDERSKLIETQLEKISHMLTNMSQEVSTKCDSTSHQLENIGQFLNDKQESLTKSLMTYSDHTDVICGKMDSQTQTLAALTQKTANDSERITLTLTEQATTLSLVASDALNQTMKNGEAFQDQTKAMTQVLNDMITKTECLEHDVALRTKDIAASFEKNTETIQHELTEQSEIVQTFLDQNSAKAIQFLTEQGDNITKSIDKKFSHMMAQMEQQTTQLQNFSENTTNSLQETVSTFEGQANRIDEAVKYTLENLTENIATISSHSNEFKQMAENFRLQIDQTDIQLKSQHDDVIYSLTDVSAHLDNSLKNLKDQSGSLGEHVQEIIHSIIGQTEHLSEHMGDICEKTDHTIRNIHEIGETVNHHFSSTDEISTSLSKNWQKTAILIENQCRDTLSRLDKLSEKMVGLEHENSHAADIAEENILKIVDHMQHASESIFLASASAVEAADETNRVIDEHTVKFQQLINALKLSNKSILIDAESIEQKNKEKNGHHFSTLASKVIEQLQSLSIDINRYFEAEVPDKVWQSYTEGDKNSFVRRLKKITGKKYAAAISEKYKSDPEFRKYALEYMQIFEDLMSQSMAPENYSAFSVALISSEIGKIYLALALATERLSS